MRKSSHLAASWTLHYAGSMTMGQREVPGVAEGVLGGGELVVALGL